MMYYLKHWKVIFIKQILDQETRDPYYKYLVEMFLYEMRQLSFEDVQERFSQWLLGGRNYTRDDFLKKQNNEYQIKSFIANIDGELRGDFTIETLESQQQIILHFKGNDLIRKENPITIKNEYNTSVAS